MSKRTYILRYSLILKRLQAKPYSSFEDLVRSIERQSDYLQTGDGSLNLGFVKRTFQREIKAIRETFGIDIQYSTKNKGYYIVESPTDTLNFDRMMEAFDIFNSLNLAQDLQPYVHLEKRRPTGMENLYGLLHAIKNKLQIKFSYQKHWEEEPSIRSAEPYALKEFKNRWYVLAKVLTEDLVKTFGLDRISNLEITRHKFQYPKDYDIEASYRYCFGIISPTGQKPQEIILSFEPNQGNYIKSPPLHDKQEILIDNEDELRIKLKLYVTDDFIMELLSFGDSMKVLEPKSLADRIKAEQMKAFAQYEK
jgi:predicted DNA-binding transcriptional regulator YafY